MKFISLYHNLKQQAMKTVNDYFNAILQGAGWCTDTYVLELPLSKPQQYELMTLLAEHNILCDEYMLDVEVDDDKLQIDALMDVDEVENQYGDFIEPIKEAELLQQMSSKADEAAQRVRNASDPQKQFFTEIQNILNS